MQIGKLLYPISTLGPGTRLGIWTIGCLRNCEGCANPELQPFNESKNIEVDEIMKFVKSCKCERVTISGGEPFLQSEELKELVEKLNNENIKDILIYSGFTKQELEQKNDENINYVLNHIAVLIDGPFVKSLVDDVPLRGSSNQKVWLYRREFQEEYSNFLKNNKEVNIFEFTGETHFIGIPVKDYKKIYPKILKQKHNSSNKKTSK